MKTYNFEMKSPSKQAQKVLKRKLFFLEMKNNIKDFFSLSTLKIALPAFAFALFLVGGLSSQWLLLQNNSTSQHNHYLTQVQNKLQQTENNYYQKYALLRSIKN